jgi:ACS family tartrate transporter-like MFS transporter
VSFPPEADEALGKETIKRLMRRLIPLFVLLFFINYLDRTNISVAALDMNSDLNLSSSGYGFAAGIFSISYAILEIPSNIILNRVGARRWLARIMISWGIVGMLTSFVFDAFSLDVARLLMGAAEAGFFPGIVLYMTQWFPAKYRATAMTTFMIGNPLATVIGSPLSAAVLLLPDIGGFHSWQWLFVLEAIPAVIIGFVLLKRLDDKPADAKWLTVEQKGWLARQSAAEAAEKERAGVATSTLAGLRNIPTILLGLNKFLVLSAQLGVLLWLPQILKTLGQLNTLQISLLNGAPFLFAAVFSVLIGRHSDRRQERTLHIAVPAFLGAAGFVLAAVQHNLVLGGIGITVATVGVWVSNTLAWSLPPRYLAGAALASGIALVNSLGNLGGFFGPFIVGWLKDTTGGYQAPLLVLAVALAANGVIVLGLAAWDRHTDRRAASAPLDRRPLTRR